MRILVVEDDPTIAQLIDVILQQEKYAVDLAKDGQVGLDLSESYEYDVVLLDISLPKRDGISICQQIRATGNTVPILLLTALDSAADRVRGLNAGADDYLSKPFDPAELLARIRTLLRRSHPTSTPVLTWGDLQLDPVSAKVTYADRVVAVTPKEYAMLELFLRNSKRVFSCSTILDHLWSYDEAPSEEAIRTHIKGLRQKLKLAGAAADLVETVYGIGYRLKPLAASTGHAPPTATLLINAWEKFKGQINEQVTVLDQLAMRFLNQDLPPDWQATGRDIAHSLAGSLGTFGFPLGSELARQIERLLGGHKNLDAEQGQRLCSLVAALQQELDRPISIPDVQSFESDNATTILVVTADPHFTQAIQTASINRGWRMQTTTTINAARTQLQQHPTHSILLAPASTDRTEDVLRLLLESSKHVPPVPVVLATNTPMVYPEMSHLGVCVNLPLTNIPDIMAALERVMQEVELSQTHVLVVDDDLKVLAILQALLLPWGFKVTTLSDPQQFWVVLDAAQPDLLILDAKMPSISGMELCQAVREQTAWAELPIIFLTSYTEPSLIQQVFAIGADDFVTKPVIGPEIILRITNLLERKKLQRLQAAERSNASPAALSTSLQLAIAHLQDALAQLQHHAVDLHSPAGYQLLQNAAAQVDKLRQLTSSDHLEVTSSNNPNFGRG